MNTNMLWDNDNVTQKSVINAEGQSKEENVRTREKELAEHWEHCADPNTDAENRAVREADSNREDCELPGRMWL